MSVNLCNDCANLPTCEDGTWESETICPDYKSNKPTDKQLKEQAEKEIARILARLNAECEMIVGCVFVDCQKTFDADGKAVKEHCGFEVSILMK
jgi:hypothetical protein